MAEGVSNRVEVVQHGDAAGLDPAVRAAPAREALLALPQEERQAALASLVRERAAHLLRLDPERLDPDLPLPLDSLAAAELKNLLEEEAGAAPPLDVFLDGASPRLLAAETARTLAAGEVPQPGPRPRPPAAEHPLSHGQRSLWFVHRLDPASGAYNLAFAARLRADGGKPVDPAALSRALAALVERHPALRTTYEAPAGEPVQRVAPGAPLDFAIVDAAGWSAAETAEWLAGEAHRPFDLARSALRARLLSPGAGEPPVLLLAVHHLSADFWSLVLLLDDLGHLYQGESPGPRPRLAYTDYVHWQREMLAGPAGERLWAWWRDALAGAEGEIALLDLPADRQRPASPSHRGGSRAFRLAPGLLAEVRALASISRATLFVVLLAAFQALLGRYTGRDDLLVGAPAAGRGRRELEGLAGHFVNLLALRADLAGDPPFSELLARARRNVAGAVEHQDFPFPLLVEQLQPARDPARPPLVQAALALEEAPRLEREGVGPFLLGSEGAVLRLGRLSLEAVALPRRAAQLELVLMMVAAAGGLAARLDYSAELFDAATAERMAGHFAALLAGAVAGPGRRLSELPLLSAPERAQVRWEWNDTTVVSATATTSVASERLEELFREQAARHPERPAVDDGSRRWTYGELAGRASRLAVRLRELGVGPEVPVGLHLDRSAPLVAAILATLEAGGVYLPLDPDHPRERLELFLRESGARVLLTAAAPGDEPRGRQAHTLWIEDLDELGAPAASRAEPAGPSERFPHRGPGVGLAATGGPPASSRDSTPAAPSLFPEGLAYLLYTSGSTGEPKAVGCHHLGAANLLADYAARYPFGPGDRCSWWTSPGFDASVLEVFPGLLAGATLLPVPAAVRADGRRFAAWLERERISYAYVPPFFVGDLADHLEAGGGLALRLALVGVEPIAAPLLAGIARRVPGLTILNGYGPTEGTVVTTYYTVGPGETRRGRTPIGRPVRGAAVHVLDRGGGPAPIGVPGEVWLGGAGVARGYHGRADLTAERFLPDPFAGEPGARLYRTGDLARLLPNGNLEFIGRADRQVKVRGMRVELAEVEAALRSHPAVREAAVDLRDGRIVGYAVTGGDAVPGGCTAADRGYSIAPAPPGGPPRPDTAELRRFLAGRLPEPMVPSSLVWIEELPLTVHGKVDRRRLPSPPAAAAGRPPRSELERRLAALWREALGVERVGADDNFFELGGHSLLLARLQPRLAEAAGREVSMVELLSHPTIAGLAAHLAAAPDAEPAAGEVPDPPARVEAVLDRAAARRTAMARTPARSGGPGARPR